MQKCSIMERKREKQKKTIAPLDDDGPIVHCSMGNSMQAPETLTADKKAEADAHTVQTDRRCQRHMREIAYDDCNIIFFCFS